MDPDPFMIYIRMLKVPPPPIFICENNRKSNKIMHCVEKKILIGSFKDKAIFHVILIDR